MKKILLPVILLTCIITGILQSDFRQQKRIESILAEETYMMPDGIIIDPLFDPRPY